MLDRAILFVDTHKSVIEDQAKYLHDVDWTAISIRKERQYEHKLHVTILKSITDRLKYIEKEAGDEVAKNGKLKKFCKKLIKLLEDYIDRSNSYFRTERWQDYDDQDEKSLELEFQNTILGNVVDFSEVISKLNIEREVKDIVIDTHSNKTISFAMRSVIEKKYPQVQEFLKRKKYVS